MAMTENTSPKTDTVSHWLDEANRDFFAAPAKVDSRTVVRAAIGFAVFAIGVGIITLQALSSL